MGELRLNDLTISSRFHVLLTYVSVCPSVFVYDKIYDFLTLINIRLFMIFHHKIISLYDDKLSLSFYNLEYPSD